MFKFRIVKDTTAVWWWFFFFLLHIMFLVLQVIPGIQSQIQSLLKFS